MQRCSTHLLVQQTGFAKRNRCLRTRILGVSLRTRGRQSDVTIVIAGIIGVVDRRLTHAPLVPSFLNHQKFRNFGAGTGESSSLGIRQLARIEQAVFFLALQINITIAHPNPSIPLVCFCSSASNTCAAYSPSGLLARCSITLASSYCQRLIHSSLPIHFFLHNPLQRLERTLLLTS